MNNLSAFLNPEKVDNMSLVVSPRFKDEEGKPVPFVIRPITQQENDALARQSTRAVTVKGQQVEKLNNVEYCRRIVTAATLTPDFSDEALCRAYGTMDPLEVPGRMLLVGEYNRLLSAIMKLSGLDDNVEEQAKN